MLDGYDRVLAVARQLPWPIGERCDWRRLPARYAGSAATSRSALESPTGAPLGEISARAALVTVPLAVLKRAFDDPESPGALRLLPEPPGKREALAYLEMGPAMKVVLLFNEIFWDALPQVRQANHQLIALPRLSFLFSNDPVMATWWTPHPVVAPMLTGWAAGPRAAGWPP